MFSAEASLVSAQPSLAKAPRQLHNSSIKIPVCAECTHKNNKGEDVHGRSSFQAHDPEIMCQWPHMVQLWVPYVLTARSGVTKQLLKGMTTFLMQPNTSIAGERGNRLMSMHDSSL